MLRFTQFWLKRFNFIASIYTRYVSMKTRFLKHVKASIERKRQSPLFLRRKISISGRGRHKKVMAHDVGRKWKSSTLHPIVLDERGDVVMAAIEGLCQGISLWSDPMPPSLCIAPLSSDLPIYRPPYSTVYASGTLLTPLCHDLSHPWAYHLSTCHPFQIWYPLSNLVLISDHYIHTYIHRMHRPCMIV